MFLFCIPTPGLAYDVETADAYLGEHSPFRINRRSLTDARPRCRAASRVFRGSYQPVYGSGASFTEPATGTSAGWSLNAKVNVRSLLRKFLACSADNPMGAPSRTA